MIKFSVKNQEFDLNARRFKMTLEEIYYLVDDFYINFIPQWKKYLMCVGKRHRNREGRLTTSEIMTIFILFQSSKKV